MERNEFTHDTGDGFAIHLNGSLDDLSAMLTNALDADNCVIQILGERNCAEIGLYSHATRFGDVLEYPGDGKQTTTCIQHDSMYSSIISGEKIIGFIQVYRFGEKNGFTQNDLTVLDTLSFMVAQAIEAIQLQKIVESRITKIGAHSDAQKRPTLPQATNLVTHSLAKSFYREMTLAGLSFSQIIHIASEIISELNKQLNKRIEQQLMQGVPSEHH